MSSDRYVQILDSLLRKAHEAAAAGDVATAEKLRRRVADHYTNTQYEPDHQVALAMTDQDMSREERAALLKATFETKAEEALVPPGTILLSNGMILNPTNGAIVFKPTPVNTDGTSPDSAQLLPHPP